MKTKDQYIRCLTVKLKEWDDEIKQLTTRHKNNTEHFKHTHFKDLEALRAKQYVASEKMKELHEAGDDAWVPVARAANKVWDDLRSGIAHVSQRGIAFHDGKEHRRNM
jgi:hypothetical protein